MKKIITYLLTFTILLQGLCLNTLAFDDASFASESVVLMDANTKRVLYEKNGNEKRYPASTTKIMTMLLGVEKGDLTKNFTMSQEAALSIEFGSSHISLNPGETISLKDALYATSLASANDAANGVAEAVGGTIENFVKMMNDRAKEIGCTNTHFVNPHGLHDDDHYTTAIDLAKIMSEASHNKDYIDITTAKEITIAPTNKTSEERYLYTTNSCMDDESQYYIPEVISAKSGFTDEALSCFVAYAKKGDVELVAVVMKANFSDDCYEDLQKLFEEGFAAYQSYPINQLFTDTKMPHHFYEVGGQVKLANEFLPAAIQKDDAKQFHIETTYQKNAKAKNVGDVVGKATLYDGEKALISHDIILEKELHTIWYVAFRFILTLLKWLIIMAIIVVVGAISAKKIYTYYRNQQIRKRKERR